ncbi:MAG: PAS domain-containing protein [Candidatus Omnitrophica bacterium]|nr:PAS domain-containing protein [Candidatus Omnitrophota bacterium]
MTGPLVLCFGVALAAVAWRMFFLRRKLREVSGYAEKVSEALREKVRSAEEEKNRILAILESMAEGVAVIDPDQRITLVNPALTRALSFPKGQIERRYFWEIFRDSIVNEMIAKTLKEHVPVRREHSILLSDSVFQIRISPVFGGGHFLGAAAIFHDVTKLKELERVRSEFVANVSHELKTPLTSILGFVETLKEGAVENKADRDHFLGIIEGHSKKLTRLIEDLLSLSRLDTDRTELRKETCDLAEALERALAFFERPIRMKKLKIRTELSPRPFPVRADPSALGEILNNLLDNAIKYNVEGGEIRVKASGDGAWTSFEIQDTGIGISAGDLPRIFDRFYRADKSRSRQTGGTGLGLAIVKRIVERHSGRVEARSAPNQGSTFTVTLPQN